MTRGLKSIGLTFLNLGKGIASVTATIIGASLVAGRSLLKAIASPVTNDFDAKANKAALDELSGVDAEDLSASEKDLDAKANKAALKELPGVGAEDFAASEKKA